MALGIGGHVGADGVGVGEGSVGGVRLKGFWLGGFGQRWFSKNILDRKCTLDVLNTRKPKLSLKQKRK